MLMNFKETYSPGMATIVPENLKGKVLSFFAATQVDHGLFLYLQKFWRNEIKC